MAKRTVQQPKPRIDKLKAALTKVKLDDGYDVDDIVKIMRKKKNG